MSAVGSRPRGALADTGRLLGIDVRDLPCRPAAHAVVAAMERVRATEGEDVVRELLDAGLAHGSEERFAEHVAPVMRDIPAATFAMGTAEADARHFCGETPRHSVELSAFAIAAVPVTNALFGLFDRQRRDGPRPERDRPVVDVSWHEASLFATWMGCRLPTEAQWELACGAGADGEWCCRDAHDLARHAWYSENSRGMLHDVATREPNALELFDLHGNVWEWCVDDFDQDWYSRSPRRDPVALARDGGGRDKSIRGGSVHALAEMCRTRYRLHEPAHYWAGDLGFRLARAHVPEGGQA